MARNHRHKALREQISENKAEREAKFEEQQAQAKTANAELGGDANMMAPVHAVEDYEKIAVSRFHKTTGGYFIRDRQATEAYAANAVNEEISDPEVDQFYADRDQGADIVAPRQDSNLPQVEITADKIQPIAIDHPAAVTVANVPSIGPSLG